MRNRERGASQIPLVICIVLLLIAGVFAYTKYSEAESLEGRLNQILDAAKEKDAATPPSDSTVKDLLRQIRGPIREAKGRLDEVLAETGGVDEENQMGFHQRSFRTAECKRRAATMARTLLSNGPWVQETPITAPSCGRA